MTGPVARRGIRLAAACLLTALVAACGGGPGFRGDGPPADGAAPPLPPDPLPRAEPRSRYGNPSSYVVFGRRYQVMADSAGYVERGIASWYGQKFHGRRTSSGEPYDMHRMTAAHRSLPLPTYVEVTNLENGRRAVVRVNDRGPFHDNRIIDLSFAAARRLNIVGRGTGLVEVRALVPGGMPRFVPPAAAAQPVAALRSAEPPAAVPARAPRLYLQAGAFSDRSNATRLRARLASLASVTVTVEESVSGGQRMHRVRLGPLTGVDEADRLTADIVAAGMDLPRIVIE